MLSDETEYICKTFILFRIFWIIYMYQLVALHFHGQKNGMYWVYDGCNLHAACVCFGFCLYSLKTRCGQQQQNINYYIHCVDHVLLFQKKIEEYGWSFGL